MTVKQNPTWLRGENVSLVTKKALTPNIDICEGPILDSVNISSTCIDTWSTVQSHVIRTFLTSASSLVRSRSEAWDTVTAEPSNEIRATSIATYTHQGRTFINICKKAQEKTGHGIKQLKTGHDIGQLNTGHDIEQLKEYLIIWLAPWAGKTEFCAVIGNPSGKDGAMLSARICPLNSARKWNKPSNEQASVVLSSWSAVLKIKSWA